MKAFNLHVVLEGGSDGGGQERRGAREGGSEGGREVGKEGRRPRRLEQKPAGPRGFFGSSPLFVVVSGSRYA